MIIKGLANGFMFVDYKEHDETFSLFASISKIVYGSFDYHRMVRFLCVDYIWKNKEKKSFIEKIIDFKVDNWLLYCILM